MHYSLLNYELDIEENIQRDSGHLDLSSMCLLKAVLHSLLPFPALLKDLWKIADMKLNKL